MHNRELVERVEQRLDNIESKLDKHLEQVSTNKADISWIKGHIKISVTTTIALVTGLVTTIFKVFFKTIYNTHTEK